MGEPQGLQSDLLRGIERASQEEDLLKACADRIVLRHCTGEAVVDRYRQDVFMHVLSVLWRISRSGVPSSAVLDHYYVLERMRRWGTMGERNGVCSPLLTPSFQRAALALAPGQRRANMLHRRLTERLVPEWNGVPFSPAKFRTLPRGAALSRSEGGRSEQTMEVLPDHAVRPNASEGVFRLIIRVRASSSLG